MRLSIFTMLALVAAMPAAADDLDAQAVAMFEATYSKDQCFSYDASTSAPTRREVTIDGMSGPETVTTFEFTCITGAYNMISAFLIYDANQGLRPLGFAVPQLDIQYQQTGESTEDSAQASLERMDVSGYKTVMMLANPSVDEKTGEITSYEKWRGVGDASASGHWALTRDGYVLSDYEVDPTYDGAINPVVVLENGQPPATE